MHQGALPALVEMAFQCLALSGKNKNALGICDVGNEERFNFSIAITFLSIKILPSSILFRMEFGNIESRNLMSSDSILLMPLDVIKILS